MKIITLIMICFSFLMAEFIKKGNTVFDTKTKLVWQDNSDVEHKEMLYSEADTYCKELVLSGHKDWRLPSLTELQNIVDLTRYEPSINRVFEYTGEENHWSSTLYADDADRAWAVNFKSGGTSHNRHSYDYYVRCVRTK